MKKILISVACHESLMQGFLAKNYEVIYEPNISIEELVSKIKNVEGLVVTTKLKIDKRILDLAINLKWIGRLGSGMELIDVDYATKKNIACISSPEGNAQAVGEHCIAMLLCMMNNIAKSFEEVKHKLWLRDENRGEEINNKIIGIIGFGNTGNAFARCIVGFEPEQILVYDKYKKVENTKHIIATDLNTLLHKSDIISIHLPLTPETKYLVNKEFINKISKKVYLINSSRGEIINTKELLDANNKNTFKGILLDVLENEKLQTMTLDEQQTFDALRNCSNVIITPHIAGYSYEAYKKMGIVLLQKLESKKFI